MEIIFAPTAESDLLYWKKSGNEKIMKRIEALLTSIVSTPFAGIGKPEALKYNYTGFSAGVLQKNIVWYIG